MNLTNKTNFNTKQLKAFIRMVAGFETLTTENMNQLRVLVKYRRGKSSEESRGSGNYGAWKFTLAVPNCVAPNKAQLAMTIGCLLCFCQNQKNVGGTRYAYGQGWQEHWAWANELPLEIKQSEEKPDLPKREKIIEEMAHCEKMIRLWETKAKLAKTKQKIWQRKFSYHERRFKAA